MNTNPIGTVGLMLTLAGLVGSFFNIQLSQWVRDLLALETKVNLNKIQGDDNQRKAIVESKIEYTKLMAWQNLVVFLMVILFVLFVLVNGLMMIVPAELDPVYPHVHRALWVFIVYFLLFSFGLIVNGMVISRKIKKMLAASTA